MSIARRSVRLEFGVGTTVLISNTSDKNVGYVFVAYSPGIAVLYIYVRKLYAIDWF